MTETGEGVNDYQPPPEGWRDFGYHAPLSPVPPLRMSDENGPDGLPRWEQHLDGSTCTCEVE